MLLVCDNLNTHTRGAFYKAFEPGPARTIIDRLEFHYTPKHGSWLNITENELSCMTWHCVKDRSFATTIDERDGGPPPACGLRIRAGLLGEPS